MDRLHLSRHYQSTFILLSSSQHQRKHKWGALRTGLDIDSISPLQCLLLLSMVLRPGRLKPMVSRPMGLDLPALKDPRQTTTSVVSMLLADLLVPKPNTLYFMTRQDASYSKSGKQHCRRLNPNVSQWPATASCARHVGFRLHLWEEATISSRYYLYIWWPVRQQDVRFPVSDCISYSQLTQLG